MKRNTIYRIIIGFLLVLNLLQLFGFLFKPKPQRPQLQKDMLEKRAKKMMQLNNEQQHYFLRLVEEHRKRIIKLHDTQIELSKQYFNRPSDSLLKLIANTEIEKISTTEQHFAAIKNILHKKQIPLFERFKKDALKGILKSSSTSEHPPKEKHNRQMPPPPPPKMR